MCAITIITPTYNREKLLGRLYTSLKSQSCKDFVWLIVDDGSVDQTRHLCEQFVNQEKDFKVQYVYQENGGKHTALNRALEYVSSELVFIVDSDDYLPQNAIQIIMQYHQKYSVQKIEAHLCGYSFLRCHADGTVNTAYFPENEKIDTYCNVRINGNIGGDKAEVFYSDILKRYPFPVFEGEKFLAEDVIWMQMSGPYNMVHINETIYICDYLEGGLTKTGRKLKVKSPKGMMLRSKIYLDDENVCTRIKFKMMLLYIIYGGFAGMNARLLFENIHQRSLFFLLYMPGKFIQKKWEKQV